MATKPNKTLDCLGLYCPEPVFKTRMELDELKKGEILEVLADDPAAEADIHSLVKNLGHELMSVKKEGDKVHILIKKAKQERRKTSGKKKVLYVQTSGVGKPERTYAPFICATIAAMMDTEATVYFVIRGITFAKKREAEKIKLGNFPSLKEVMDKAVKAGAKLAVCEQSCNLLGIPRGDFTSEGKIVGAATLNDLALEADAVLSF